MFRLGLLGLLGQWAWSWWVYVVVGIGGTLGVVGLELQGIDWCLGGGRQGEQDTHTLGFCFLGMASRAVSGPMESRVLRVSLP